VHPLAHHPAEALVAEPHVHELELDWKTLADHVAPLRAATTCRNNSASNPASTTTAAEPICSRSEDDRAGTTLANTGVLDAGVAAFIQR
jgi:hypothetical protein